MSIYHFHVKTISRMGSSVGMSAVAAASYRSGTAIKNERDGITHDYTKKRGIVFSEILSPIESPDWTRDRGALWNAVEHYEKRRDARLAREVEVALPVELERDRQLDLVREFARSEFVKLGMVADVCVHDKGDGNPHAHILLTDRPVREHGFENKKDTSWNTRDLVLRWRKSWEMHVNFALERCGISEKVSCKSLVEQGMDRIPQIHVGSKDARDGGHEARRARNENIKAYNEAHTVLMGLDKEIVKLKKQIAAKKVVPIELKASESMEYAVKEAEKALVEKVAEKLVDDRQPSAEVVKTKKQDVTPERPARVSESVLAVGDWVLYKLVGGTSQIKGQITKVGDAENTMTIRVSGGKDFKLSLSKGTVEKLTLDQTQVTVRKIQKRDLGLGR